MEHTPGSWSINDWPHNNADMSIGAPGTPKIAIIPLRDVSINEQKANAALIAAAPDMYEAIVAVLGWYNGPTDIEDLLRQALLKAKSI